MGAGRHFKLWVFVKFMVALSEPEDGVHIEQLLKSRRGKSWHCNKDECGLWKGYCNGETCRSLSESLEHKCMNSVKSYLNSNLIFV